MFLRGRKGKKSVPFCVKGFLKTMEEKDKEKLPKVTVFGSAWCVVNPSAVDYLDNWIEFLREFHGCRSKDEDDILVHRLSDFLRWVMGKSGGDEKP